MRQPQSPAALSRTRRAERGHMWNQSPDHVLSKRDTFINSDVRRRNKDRRRRRGTARANLSQNGSQHKSRMLIEVSDLAQPWQA